MAENNQKSSDIVISSRVRLARNIDKFPFPARMTDEQFSEVLQCVRDASQSEQGSSFGFKFNSISDMDALDKQALVERHLVSPDLISKNKPCGVVISSDEKISIMINEEDHVRIQCLFPGMNVNMAKELCNVADDMLEKKLDFAFSPQYGYLTCCPTNLGTGIRVSVMLHLPALSMSNNMQKILEICSRLGIAVRGIYGENSESTGNLFQVSNQTTLGQTEDEILANVKNVVNQIVDSERSLRSELYSQNPIELEDSVFRSFGILTNARTITTAESLKLISAVRMGADMGIIKEVDVEKLNQLMYWVQPALLQKKAGRLLNQSERDTGRAEMIRESLINTREG